MKMRIKNREEIEKTFTGIIHGENSSGGCMFVDQMFADCGKIIEFSDAGFDKRLGESGTGRLWHKDWLEDVKEENLCEGKLEVKKYRKKPVVVEAVQWTGDNLAELRAFVPSEFRWNKIHQPMGIITLEGVMAVCEGDYVIKGVKGEFYPCKPDIFEMTYEEE